jgi:hypothetical protein
MGIILSGELFPEANGAIIDTDIQTQSQGLYYEKTERSYLDVKTDSNFSRPNYCREDSTNLEFEWSVLLTNTIHIESFLKRVGCDSFLPCLPPIRLSGLSTNISF